MTDVLILVLGLCGVFLSWRNERLRGSVKTLNEQLSDQRSINGQLNLQVRNQQAILEQPNPYHADLAAALAITDSLHEQLGAERRSNASLRGQITKMKGKV